MNKIFLIGNMTSAPEIKGTPSGQTVCSFGLAVNERRGGQEQTQFYKVSVWGKLGESCKTYLDKGEKVFVSGPLTARAYSKSDGTAAVSLDVTAGDIEFLSPRSDPHGNYPAPAMRQNTQMEPVETDELPF